MTQIIQPSTAQAELNLSFSLNGEALSVHVPPAATLLDILRDHAQLSSAREGCRIGRCGACTVLMDNQSVPACLVNAWQLEGCQIRTVEGLDHDQDFQAVKAAMVAESAMQCGYCSPGMAISLVSCMKHEAQPAASQLADALTGNLCRCTGYGGMQRVVQALADESETPTQR